MDHDEMRNAMNRATDQIPTHGDGRFVLWQADCREALARLDDNSVDAIVTDPPYELGFMGKTWDASGIAYDVEMWREALRVLKPGGHLLAFGGSRTYHRLACAVEDAGFEIRDQIMWVYGCLDEQTQVVTESGVKHYRETKIGERVLCYDVATGTYSYQPVLEVVEYDYSDTAYRLVGDNFTQVVTRNHRCIVEQGGSETFHYAETLQQQARVPVLESLPELQRALHDAHKGAGHAEQGVWAEVRGRTVKQENDRKDETVGGTRRAIRRLRGVRTRSVEARQQPAPRGTTRLLAFLQRQDARPGTRQALPQSARGMDRGIKTFVSGENDRPEQPGMEGWADLPQPQGRIQRATDQVCQMPGTVLGHGPQGWLRHGASAERGAGVGTLADTDRVRPPHQPRRDGQQTEEPDAVRYEPRPQEVRAWAGHRTAVVRVVPFHHVGKVWCLRVPTGAFVAIRDGVAFPTGNSGFPKSLDVSKAIDKQRTEDLQPAANVAKWLCDQLEMRGIGRREVSNHFGAENIAQQWTTYWTDGAVKPRVPRWEQWMELRQWLNLPDEMDSEVWRLNGRKGQPGENWAKREVVGTDTKARSTAGSSALPTVGGTTVYQTWDITAPATDAAKQWNGWGTALKPAHEPIVVARKPLESTVAANVLKWGTGALNIDGTRVGTEGGTRLDVKERDHALYAPGSGLLQRGYGEPVPGLGRWPANFIHDGSDEVVALFPESKASGTYEGNGKLIGSNKVIDFGGDSRPSTMYSDACSAARFFYCAKASKAERNAGLGHLDDRLGGSLEGGNDKRNGDTPQLKPTKNHHPTVKPIALMRYLIRLVTPPGGVVLDPFAGSGTTMVAALMEGVTPWGCEMTEDYIPIILGRIQWALDEVDSHIAGTL